MIVHIVFEKLTGLKGTIEGYFHHRSGTVDNRLPVVYIGGSRFRQGEQIIILEPLTDKENYIEHLNYGVNLLIKEWNGRGELLTVNNRNPN